MLIDWQPESLQHYLSLNPNESMDCAILYKVTQLAEVIWIRFRSIDQVSARNILGILVQY